MRGRNNYVVPMKIMIPLDEWSSISPVILGMLTDDYELDTHYVTVHDSFRSEMDKFIYISELRTNSGSLMVYLNLWKKAIVKPVYSGNRDRGLPTHI